MSKLTGTITKTEKDGIVIHSYLSPEDGDKVCSHIIETQKSLVIIDTLLLKKHAKELRGYVDGLGKRIDRVIITHSHPDHWLGLEYFKDVPSYALAETIGELTQYGDMLLQSKQATKGDLVTSEKTVPGEALPEGELKIDGLTLVCEKVIGAESTIAAVIKLPALKTVIAQDLVYNKVYLYIGDKNYLTQEFCFKGWERTLNALKAEHYETVLPGHGLPCGPKIFDELLGYLAVAKKAVATGSGEEMQKILSAKYPDYTVPEMLGLSAYQLFESLMGKASHGDLTLLVMTDGRSDFISQDVAVGEGPILFNGDPVMMRWTSILLGFLERKDDGTSYVSTSHHFESINREDNIDFTSFEDVVMKTTDQEGVFSFATRMRIVHGKGRFNAGELVSDATLNMGTGVTDIHSIKGKVFKK